MDMIEQPPHYTFSGIQPIEVIRAWELPYELGCCIKYLCRYSRKNGIEDLKKARQYLDMYVSYSESQDDERGVKVLNYGELFEPEEKVESANEYHNIGGNPV